MFQEKRIKPHTIDNIFFVHETLTYNLKFDFTSLQLVSIFYHNDLIGKITILSKM